MKTDNLWNMIEDFWNEVEELSKALCITKQEAMQEVRENLARRLRRSGGRQKPKLPSLDQYDGTYIG